MAEALPPDGSLLTCEIDEDAAAIAREHFGKAPHCSKIDLRVGPAMATLERLARSNPDGPFELVFIDADKRTYRAYYDFLMKTKVPPQLARAEWKGLCGARASEGAREMPSTNHHSWLPARGPWFCTSTHP